MRDDILMKSVTQKRPTTASASKNAPHVYVFPDVLEEMAFNGQWDDKLVSLGVLIGNRYVCPTDGKAFVEIEGFVAGQHVGSWETMRSQFENEWKGALAAQRFHSSQSIVVGWYIGNGAANEGNAEVLAQIHKAFFRHPWQTGLWFRGEVEPVAFTLNEENIQPVEFAVIQTSTFTSVG